MGQSFKSILHWLDIDVNIMGLELYTRYLICFQAGFFKRQYKSILQEENRRDSWSYVNSKGDDD